VTAPTASKEGAVTEKTRLPPDYDYVWPGGAKVLIKPKQIAKEGASEMGNFSRFIAITLSAALCAIVAWYIYQLIWVGNMADLGISITWKGKAVPLQPAVYSLVFLGAWLSAERISAYANPGHGGLWWYDVVPSVLLLGWLLFTGFVHFWREFAFSDPSLLWIYVTFAFSGIVVVATSAFFWFGERSAAPPHTRHEEVTTARDEPKARLVAGRPPLAVAGTSPGQYVSVLPGGSFTHIVPDGYDVLFKRTGHSDFRLDNVPKERAVA